MNVPRVRLGDTASDLRRGGPFAISSKAYLMTEFLVSCFPIKSHLYHPQGNIVTFPQITSMQYNC